MELKNAVVFVTGGSSGLGLATAKMLIAEGAQVIISGRDKDKLSKVATEIGALGLSLDASNAVEVKSAYTAILEQYGKLDVLVNNAGIGGGWTHIDELDIEAMQEVYATNVFGAALNGAEAAKIFKAQNHGNIINIASTAGTKGFARGTVYASSKFALRGMTQCWQAELRPHNVRVMLVNPSEVPTAFGQEDRSEKPEADNKLSSNEIAHTILSCLKMDNRGFIPEVTVFATNPF